MFYLCVMCIILVEKVESLTALAGQVCDLIRERIGSEAYAEALAHCQKAVNQKRAKRKIDSAAMVGEYENIFALI